MKQEGKQRKWLEPVSVRAGCGGSARRRSFVSVKEVAFCFFAVWRFSVKVFCGSPFFFLRGEVSLAWHKTLVLRQLQT